VLYQRLYAVVRYERLLKVDGTSALFTCNIVIVLSFLFVSEIRVNQGQTNTACTFHTLNLEDIFTLPSVPAQIEILGHSETVRKTSMFLFCEQC